ncbi:MAG: hypothetical protein RIT45_3785 [Pseudomonadota bacterium]|jgi:hypothetical protein
MTRRHLIALVVTLCSALALPVVASAADPGATGGTATFVVRVIEASQAAAPKVDARLGEMRREMRPFEGRYNHFTLLSEQTFTLQIGKDGSVSLPGGGAFVLELMGFVPGKVRRVRYQVTSPGAKQTRSVAPGGRTLDAIPNDKSLTIVATTVR